MNPGAVCAALENALAGWPGWDTEPALYTMHSVTGGCQLRRLTPVGTWPEGEPLEDLAQVAEGSPLGEAITPDLMGFAFRTEVEGETGVQRWIWALTDGLEPYAAVKMLDAPGAASGQSFAAPGPVRVTLEWLVRASMARTI